jgi:predicted aspartyl protease
VSETRWRYDESYEPAAPVVEIDVQGQGPSLHRCRALVDPGLSISGVPRTVLEALQVSPASPVSIVTILGNTDVVQRYRVTVALGEIRKTLQVLPLDRDVALLGRDFLNDCVVVLDGKAQTVVVGG